MKFYTYIKTFAVLSTGLAACGLISPTPSAYAGSDPVYTSWRNNIAIEGYDPVSFFSGKPLKGNPTFQTEHKGAIWMFTSRAHLDLFKTNPSVFAPQYGGYCAWAVAHGKLAKGSPESWHVEDGRLFLNFNGRIQKKWDRARFDFIQKADESWPAILEE